MVRVVREKVRIWGSVHLLPVCVYKAPTSATRLIAILCFAGQFSMQWQCKQEVALKHRRSSSLGTGKPQQYGALARRENVQLLRHMTLFVGVSSRISRKKITKIDKETYQRASSGFSEWYYDLFKLIWKYYILR